MPHSAENGRDEGNKEAENEVAYHDPVQNFLVGALLENVTAHVKHQFSIDTGVHNQSVDVI